jgi:hypothetical protein
VIDCEEGVRYSAILYGLPQKLLRDKKKIEEIRAARDEANQSMMEAQKQQMGVDQVAKVAPAVKIASEMGQGKTG